MLHRDAVESLECFRKQGFFGLSGIVPPSQAASEYTMLARSSRM